jgi:hypothetical protein
LVEFEKGGDDGVHASGFASRLKNLHQCLSDAEEGDPLTVGWKQCSPSHEKFQRNHPSNRGSC